jgi:hypothetical protein
MKILGYHLIPEEEYQKWEKAKRLSRGLTFEQIDDIESGKIHLRRNPVRKRNENVHPIMRGIVNSIGGGE